MVQAEVADRLAAPPGSPHLRRAQRRRPPGTARPGGPARCRARCSGRSPGWIRRWSPSTGTREPRVGDRRAVFAVIDAAFAQRRKTLRSALAGWAGSAGGRRGDRCGRPGWIPAARGGEARHRRVRPDRGRPARDRAESRTVTQRDFQPVPGPVRVRVPAKINLYLSVGRSRGRRLPRPGDRLPRRRPGRRTGDRALGPAVTVRTTGDGRGARPGRRTWPARGQGAGRRTRGPASVAIEITKQIPVAGGMAGGSADAAGALVGCAALWGWRSAGTRSPRSAAELGVGRAVRADRRHRRRHRSRRAALPGAGPHPAALGARAGRGGLSTPAVFAELDRLRADGSRPPGRRGRGDAGRAGLRRSGTGRATSWQRPAGGGDLDLQPELRRTLRAGLAAGALGGVVSGSGPTVALLCADAECGGRGRRRAAPDRAPAAAVRIASGPAPGARVIG